MNEETKNMVKNASADGVIVGLSIVMISTGVTMVENPEHLIHGMELIAAGFSMLFLRKYLDLKRS